MDCVVNHILRKVGKTFLSASIAFAILGGASLAPAESTPAVLRPTLPAEFGQVIYQKYGDRPNQIFIVGQSHRSAATGANGVNTVQAQAEIYRIGEWLIRNETVGLLLPEGYFQRRKGSAPAPAGGGAAVLDASLDSETLVAKLSDTSVFVNADILLKNTFNVRLQQVEDEGVYQGVREFMQSAGGQVPQGFDMQLDYLQEIRTAAMLQNVPAAVEAEYQAGGIGQKRAMFTLGMAHLDEVIRFLDREEIQVAAPPLSPPSFQDYSAVLKLLEAGYGVTVILPRSLIDDREALRMVRLDRI